MNFFNKPHQKNYDYEDHDEDEYHEPVLKRLKSEDISMEHMAHKMSNLETLHVFDDFWLSHIKVPENLKYFEPFFNGIQHCRNLSELLLNIDFSGYANFFPNIKKLTIFGQYQLHLENLDWIAKFEKLEILKLQSMRINEKEIDVKECTKECI